MARRKLLLLLKPFDVAAVSNSKALDTNEFTRIFQTVIDFTRWILSHIENRHQVHRDAIRFCKNILQKKFVDWEEVLRDNLCQPVHNVDMVVTVGGDGTLLHASHFVDDSIPILGVNSDPTQLEEVEEFSNEFDATRSTGYLCAATVNNFEQILDDILEGRFLPCPLSRLSVSINSNLLSTYALNDILIAHPCPAAVSWFSFRVKKDSEPCTQSINCRSSGLRASTAAGSSAAMLSAGGSQMPILSQDLQYMVREPISPGSASTLMHGLIRHDQSVDVDWYSEEGEIYMDGYHVHFSVVSGDTIEISTMAPVLRVYLPRVLLSADLGQFLIGWKQEFSKM